MVRRKKSTNKGNNKNPAPKGAMPVRDSTAVIPRNPKYDYMDIRDTPLTARGMKLVYDALGSTDAGRMWALLALHPCGEYVSSCDGIPDETMAAAVTPTYRAHTTVSWNSDLFITKPEPAAGFSYDVQIVTPPFPEIDYLYRLRYNGVWSKWVAIRLPGFPFIEGLPAAKCLDAVGLSKYRFVARGMTLYLDAPRLSDNGRYVGGQVATILKKDRYEWSNESVAPKDGSDPAFGEGATSLFSITVPEDEDQLVLQDNLVAQWPARDGAYIPHRFVSPVQQYQETAGASYFSKAPVYQSDGTVTTIQVPSSALTVAYSSSQGTSIDNSENFYNPNPPWAAPSGTSALAPERCTWGVSDPGNLCTGVSFFKAISGTASIQVKSRVYLEAEAAEAASAAAPYAHKPPCLDRKALDLVTMVAQVQPHVFYARDNDFSSILQSIGKMLPGILGWIDPVADRLTRAGLPFVSPVAKGLGAASKAARAVMEHYIS